MIKRYIPILKAKLGEFDALKNLRPTRRALVTPMLDVPHRSDSAGETPSPSWDEHIRRKANHLVRSWDSDDPAFFVDFYDTDSDARTASGLHPVDAMFSLLRSRDMQAIPVTGIDRDTAYQEAVRAISASDHRGMCVRLSRDQLASVYELGRSLNAFLERMRGTRASTDLLLDFRKISYQEAGEVLSTTKKILSGLPALEEWRSVSFAGSNMPQSLATEVPGGTTGAIERLEFSCWKALAADSTRRSLGFADYGIVHPDLAYYDDPKKLTVSATIKYTLEDRILVARGFSVYKVGAGGYKQFFKLAKDVAADSGFKGENYSWGDDQIDRRCRRTEHPGNARTWIAIGTNHHVRNVSTHLIQRA